jgi:hypothetical protein
MRVALVIAGLLLFLGGYFIGRLHDQPHAAAQKESTTSGLVHGLLDEHLSERNFTFSDVMEAASGKLVLPLDDSEHGKLVLDAIDAALHDVCAQLSALDSPVRSLIRINEASRYFEDGLLEALNRAPGFTCEIPPTRDGKTQRSGYPDLMLTHTASGRTYYLDPKLVHADSFTSTLRSFYFEPKDETLKITRNACHLLIGIQHDGNQGAWSFGPWQIVDLSTKPLRLKAEFQASNAELYPAKAR